MIGQKMVFLQVKSLRSLQSEGDPDFSKSIKSSWIKLSKAIITPKPQNSVDIGLELWLILQFCSMSRLLFVFYLCSLPTNAADA